MTFPGVPEDSAQLERKLVAALAELQGAKLLIAILLQRLGGEEFVGEGELTRASDTWVEFREVEDGFRVKIANPEVVK